MTTPQKLFIMARQCPKLNCTRFLSENDFPCLRRCGEAYCSEKCRALSLLQHSGYCYDRTAQTPHALLEHFAATYSSRHKSAIRNIALIDLGYYNVPEIYRSTIWPEYSSDRMLVIVLQELLPDVQHTSDHNRLGYYSSFPVEPHQLEEIGIEGEIEDIQNILAERAPSIGIVTMVRRYGSGYLTGVSITTLGIDPQRSYAFQGNTRDALERIRESEVHSLD
ncbi:hypothetical protein BD779DRAFT_1680485 [Infundibulicybe gibba]|nr:hypothetical protein BD779DRAFT_1680485 [Infundibulicybe gibba]